MITEEEVGVLQQQWRFHVAYLYWQMKSPVDGFAPEAILYEHRYKKPFPSPEILDVYLNSKDDYFFNIMKPIVKEVAGFIFEDEYPHSYLEMYDKWLQDEKFRKKLINLLFKKLFLHSFTAPTRLYHLED